MKPKLYGSFLKKDCPAARDRYANAGGCVHLIFVRLILVLVVLSTISLRGGQCQIITPPTVEWEGRFGAAGDEILLAARQLPDGGYMLSGSADSAGTHGGLDYLIVRLNSAGSQIWGRYFGGSETDSLEAMAVMEDGGIILGGSSFSPANGNKTALHIGGGDFWIVRLDAAGRPLVARFFPSKRMA